MTEGSCIGTYVHAYICMYVLSSVYVHLYIFTRIETHTRPPSHCDVFMYVYHQESGAVMAELGRQIDEGRREVQEAWAAKARVEEDKRQLRRELDKRDITLAFEREGKTGRDGWMDGWIQYTFTFI